MDINFHYATVKVLAEHAGFAPADGELIAYASQFVDDATAYERMGLDEDPQVDGIRYSCGEFDPICTAHKDIDYAASITSRRARRLVYVCFHFIPSLAQGGEAAAARQVAPGNPLARALVEEAIAALAGATGVARERALIRIGAALHSYADTWAHQGFSGFWDSPNNDISGLRTKVDGKWRHVDPVSTFVSYAAPDIGHAEAGTLPDRTDATWDCKPPKLAPRRDNGAEFLKAAREILALLSGATGVGQPWGAIKPKLETCFHQPASGEAALPQSSWAREFPNTAMCYGSKAWFQAALRPKGGFLDVVGGLLHLDPLDYVVLGDPKYFWFHAAAQLQRGRVVRELEPRGWLE